MMKRHIMGFFALLLSLNVDAQVISEILNYSILEYGTTARSMGVGGAFGALGADMSVISINPAGTAEFRKSEFMVSLGVANQNINSNLEGNRVSTTDNKFNLESIGIVFTTPSRDKVSNFTIALNRLASFNTSFEFSGSSVGSRTERFVELGDGLDPNDLPAFDAGIAFDAGAIFDFDNDLLYDTDFGDFNVSVPKSQIVNTAGGINELAMGLATNFNNKVSLGGSIGFPFLRYEQNRTYVESDQNDDIEFFDRMEFQESVNTTGAGLNLKLGMIIKPTKMTRFGLAVHSPTVYVITDDFENNIQYEYTDQDGRQAFTGNANGNFEYGAITPWRAIASAGYLFRAGDLVGFVSGGVDYVNYASSSFNLTRTSDLSGDAEFETLLNEEIDDEFTSAMNFRVGSEIAMKKYRVRAGFNRSGNPYRFQDYTNNSFSLGGGIRLDKFYFDIAFRTRTTESEYSPYTVASNRTPNINNEESRNRLMLTAGFKI